MLGVIHRSVLGKGPPHFAQFFVQEARARRSARAWHNKQLADPRDSHHLDILARSGLGLIRVYNLLPQAAVDLPSVSSFQRFLQDMMLQRANEGVAHWASTFCPRLPIVGHPLW